MQADPAAFRYWVARRPPIVDGYHLYYLEGLQNPRDRRQWMEQSSHDPTLDVPASPWCSPSQPPLQGCPRCARLCCLYLMSERTSWQGKTSPAQRNPARSYEGSYAPSCHLPALRTKSPLASFSSDTADEYSDCYSDYSNYSDQIGDSDDASGTGQFARRPQGPPQSAPPLPSL